MINSVKHAVAGRLNEVFPVCKVYDEDIPQKFKTPSFLMTLIELDYKKRINDKYDARLSFDVAYFTNKGKEEAKEDCLEVQMTLFRAFDFANGYRFLDKSADITDNVLHFKFNVNASEISKEDFARMMRQETNTGLKE